MEIIKRIAFEITYAILLFVCIPVFILSSMVMLIIEVFKVMPKNIFEITYGLYYGKNT